MNPKLSIVRDHQYSDDWQNFQGVEGKNEYDLMLCSGDVIKNCYPGPGVFEVIGKKELIYYDDIVQIRFSNEPLSISNIEVSPVGRKFLEGKVQLNPNYPILVPEDHEVNWHEKAPPKKGDPMIAKKVPARNEPCSCGSGKKYKNCCHEV